MAIGAFKRGALAASIWAVSLAPAFAVEDNEDSSPLPAVQSFNGVSYLAGGIGLDEREAMHAVRHDYSLWLAFASKGGSAYIADTEVVIRDGKGHIVLDTQADGPWLMANLPAGQYRVTARSPGGGAVTQKIIVRGKGAQRQVMHLRDDTRG